jgi:hypothetical protein
MKPENVKFDVAINVIGGFQNIINECQIYFFVICDISFCKGYVVKFVVSLVSLNKISTRAQ